MNAKPTAASSDIRPLEFTLAVAGGGAGSAVLSALQPNPWVSVGFALAVMAVVSLLRWRLASETKDSQSLEAFAEDIYLLGYLLTLSALLGLAPRLMTDDANLFHIAGVKLFTTIAGLGVMMIFRQLARRWAEESAAGNAQQFEQQEERFRAAVNRLNRSAEELTLKMEEVGRRFDPDLLGPVAEWSNRAANALSGATRAFESIPGATAPGVRSLQELGGDLARVKVAVTELTNALTNELGTASQSLGRDLGQVGQAARTLGVSVATLTPATESGRVGLEKLGAQALQEVSRLNSVNQNLAQVAAELSKVEAVMRQLGGAGAADIAAPINRLVKALAMAADRVDTSSGHMEQLQSDLRVVSSASQTLGERLGSSVAGPLATHEGALSRMHQELEELVRQVGPVLRQMTQAQAFEADAEGRLSHEVESLRKSLEETNRQLQMLLVRTDVPRVEPAGSGMLSQLAGAGPGTGGT
jgi:hypothetical protein